MLYSVNELDVWAGEESGLWNINNIMGDCERVELKNPYSVREVLKKVREQGYNLKYGKYTTNINAYCSADLFEIIDRHNFKPILQLEWIGE